MISAPGNYNTGMRHAALALAILLLAGCAVHPKRDAVVDFAQFDGLAADERVRYERGAQAHAGRVAELLPAAIAQVAAAHYQPFAGPVIVYVCATNDCFDQRVPGAVRFTAAVIHDNRVLLAPRLFVREAGRMASATTPGRSCRTSGGRTPTSPGRRRSPAKAGRRRCC